MRHGSWIEEGRTAVPEESVGMVESAGESRKGGLEEGKGTVRTP